MRRPESGQATTEVVLMFPLFMLFLFAFVKLFALLILVQKIEIASFYAARRWQLESHRNVNFEGYDQGALLHDIQSRVETYVGYNTSASGFLDLTRDCYRSKECPYGEGVHVDRTQVWNVVTVTVCTKPFRIPLATYGAGNEPKGYVFCSSKYVPNRDRPISFILPGLKDDK